MITFYSEQHQAYDHIWTTVIPLIQANNRQARVVTGYSDALRAELPQDQQNLFSEELANIAQIENRYMTVMSVDTIEDEQGGGFFISVHGHIGGNDNPEYCVEVPISYLAFDKQVTQGRFNHSFGFTPFGVN